MSFPKRSELFEDDDEHDRPCYVEISIDRGKRKGVGFILSILTNSETHPYGIKVEIHTGEVGRVQRLLSQEEIDKENKIVAEKVVKMFGGVIQTPSTSKFFPKNQIPPPPETNEYEFKSSFKTPTQPLVPEGEIKDPEVLKNVLKNKGEKTEAKLKKLISKAVTAFANTKGGRLFIGVDDDGKVDPIFKEEFRKSHEDWDEYKRGILDSIKELTDSPSFLGRLEFQPGEDDEFLVINVQPGLRAYYVRNNEGRKEFYMRVSGESVVLSGDDLDEYKKERWPEKYGSNERYR